jgi:hypothetical protein
MKHRIFVSSKDSKGVGLIRLNIGIISESVYISVILHTIIER